MRINYKIALVGGFPIAAAALIAVSAWLLLDRAETARNGAVLAGSIYRDLLVAAAARDDYINVPFDRARRADRVFGLAGQADASLITLKPLAGSDAQTAAITTAQQALVRYVGQMHTLVDTTNRTDALVADMAQRTSKLIGLTDQARERQHASNNDILASAADSDRRLRAARGIVDSAQALRSAVSDAALIVADLAATSADPVSLRSELRFGLETIRAAADKLRNGAATDETPARSDLKTKLDRVIAVFETVAHGPLSQRNPQPVADVLEALDRLLKIESSSERALHEEAAQLLNYSVEASEIEQATQNIAVNTLKYDRRASDAFATRNVASAKRLFDDTQPFADTVATLSISPLIQGEIVEAINLWRGGLSTTAAGLVSQNAAITDMDGAASDLNRGSRLLNDLFTQDADRLGVTVRRLLAFGAAFGLLLGAGTAFFVARSITRPLRTLQNRMVALAADPASEPIPAEPRNDELGAMARAASFFVSELGRREQALRDAKTSADDALARLTATQADLVRAEKLASLGQLVAGVAHEINTPVGIALTTTTALQDTVEDFRRTVDAGRLTRSDLTRFTQRVGEGTGILVSNLARAADLVHSFKQLSADQASGDRRAFSMKPWLQEVVTSLGPALRKSGTQITLSCPDDIVLDTYPGALSQVLTNLIMNAVIHAFAPNEAGHITIDVERRGASRVTIVFRDNGRGIGPEAIGRVFDPFFTTGRHKGSTGLGLHIVHNLVAGTLGGAIGVDSRPGMGTRFTLEIPLAAAVVTKTAA